MSRLMLIVLALGACGGSGSPLPRDAALPASDGRADRPEEAGPSDPSDGRAEAPVARPDAPVDSGGDGRPDAPVDSGAEVRPDAPAVDLAPNACAVGGLCRTLRAQYADAVLRAQACTPGGAAVCQKKAPGNLGCVICEVFVSDTAELDPLRAQFTANGCERCLLGSPTGDRCHPISCPTLFTGLCRASAGGGTCINDEPPQQCPDSAAADALCPIEKWICTRDTSPKICSCTRRQNGELRWECFF
jgi:hypothetical protein